VKLLGGARSLSGYLLFLGSVLIIVNAFLVMTPSWLGSSLLWLAGLTLFFDIKRAQQAVIGIILSIGLLSCLAAWHLGSFNDSLRALTVNQSMIVMLIGVQFLQLVAVPAIELTKKLPVGKVAFIKTYFGVHFFGSVINLIALLLVADRWYKQANLTAEQQKLLVRAFSSAANWSPFFAAFAAAMIFTPKASISILMTVGFAMAAFSFLLTWVEISRTKAYSMSEFVGYPMHFGALLLPLGLVLLVFVTQYLLPSINMLLLIAVCSISVSVCVLIGRVGLTTAAAGLQTHISVKLPLMKNELLLFLAAGVLGVGLSAILDGLSVSIPLNYFDGVAAAIVLLSILIAALMGVHPVISIAIVGQWIGTIQPNQTLLAITFLMGWSIGVAVSSISGINLSLQGRYNVPASAALQWNLPYAMRMYGFACVLLMLTSYMLNL